MAKKKHTQKLSLSVWHLQLFLVDFSWSVSSGVLSMHTLAAVQLMSHVHAGLSCLSKAIFSGHFCMRWIDCVNVCSKQQGTRVYKDSRNRCPGRGPAADAGWQHVGLFRGLRPGPEPLWGWRQLPCALPLHTPHAACCNATFGCVAGCCAVLCCAALRCAVLCCAVLCCAALRCLVPLCAMLWHPVLVSAVF